MAKTSKPWQTPGVVFNPNAAQGLQSGIEQLVGIIRPTLGPLPRLTLNEQNLRTKRPELLDNGAVIARRVIQLEGRDADMGAMYLRQLLWKLYETVGDGTATAAVLFQAVYRGGVRYLAAGGNAMILRQHLELGAEFLLKQLAADYVPLGDAPQPASALTHLAETICYDPELSAGLGNIFSLVGADGRLEIRSGRTRDIEVEFVSGSYWNSGLFSPRLMTDTLKQRASLENAAIFISDMEVSEPRELIPVMEAALAGGYRSLMLILKTFPDAALGLITAPQNRQRLLVAAAKTPGVDINEIHGSLQDLAILTGGRFFSKETGDSLEAVRPEHLGTARRAWADMEYLGIVNGGGDPAVLRQHVADLRKARARGGSSPEEEKKVQIVQDRLACLLGGTGVLWVGGLSPYLVDMRKEQASRTASALRGALREGGLPGGGVALLNCRAALDARVQAAGDADERAAFIILRQAVEMPARVIWENAGYRPSEIFSRLDPAGPGTGFDVVRRQVVNMVEAGILDSAGVLRAVVSRAVLSAALALTVDVLVHKAEPLDASANP